MPIQRLTDALTQKIAAGEVIERPASAVKELVENALDAKSERIDIEVEEGGKRLLVVRDDGEGMCNADLVLSVERYATSKITTEDDLRSIETLGFRGEALASIAAVSRLRLVSRYAEVEEAYALEAEGGRVSDVAPAARAPGTTVEVRDLFYNMPARAEFLGTARTEFLHVNRTIQKFALLSPSIGWRVTHDGREVFSAPKAGELLDRIAQVYGTQTARAMIPIEGKRGEITIRGFISHPELRRGNRRDQLFVVNGRVVTDRGLSFILASAYRGILRPGNYPMAVVVLDLPPTDVDVNIHPRKEEVRFAKARQVQDTLSASLQQALSSRRVVPSPARQQIKQVKEGGDANATMVRSPPAHDLSFDWSKELAVSKGLREAEKVRVHGDRRVVGQLQATYLLVESPEGLEIIDQHVAHERVLYERLKGEFSSDGIVRQIFLIPARVEAPFDLASILASHQQELSRAGVVLDEFGGGTFLVREYPRVLADNQARRGFQQLIEKLGETLERGGDLEDELFDRMLTELACGGAIKAGERLPLAEAQALVERLMTLENPYACPHGRPIVFSIPRDELDRRFRRT